MNIVYSFSIKYPYFPPPGPHKKSGSYRLSCIMSTCDVCHNVSCMQVCLCGPRTCGEILRRKFALSRCAGTGFIPPPSPSAAVCVTHHMFPTTT